MIVEVINSKDELESVEPFRVEYLLWGTKMIPETYGYLGFVPEKGFYLKMICEESEPLRTYENVLDPVYRDSAMEAFFQFEHENGNRRTLPYLNLRSTRMGRCWPGLAAGGHTGRILRRNSFRRLDVLLWWRKTGGVLRCVFRLRYWMGSTVR